MPTSIQGIGTTYYGQREFGPDGSFITTEWVIIGGIPIVPLRSLRVRYEGADAIIFPITQREERYSVLSKTSVNWRQAMMTYGFMLFMVAWVVFLTMCYPPLSRHADETVSGVILFFAFVPAALLPVGLRIHAKQSRKAQPNQSS